MAVLDAMSAVVSEHAVLNCTAINSATNGLTNATNCASEASTVFTEKYVDPLMVALATSGAIFVLLLVGLLIFVFVRKGHEIGKEKKKRKEDQEKAQRGGEETQRREAEAQGREGEAQGGEEEGSIEAMTGAERADRRSWWRWRIKVERR